MYKTYLLVKSGFTSSWRIKDTKEERLKEMQKDFKEANLYYTEPYIIKKWGD